MGFSWRLTYCRRASSPRGAVRLLGSRRVLFFCTEAGSLELPQRPFEQWLSHPLVEQRVVDCIVRCMRKFRVPQPNGYVRRPPPAQTTTRIPWCCRVGRQLWATAGCPPTLGCPRHVEQRAACRCNRVDDLARGVHRHRPIRDAVKSPDTSRNASRELCVTAAAHGDANGKCGWCAREQIPGGICSHRRAGQNNQPLTQYRFRCGSGV